LVIPFENVKGFKKRILLPFQVLDTQLEENANLNLELPLKRFRNNIPKKQITSKNWSFPQKVKLPDLDANNGKH
jgi:hypothetical protein